MTEIAQIPYVLCDQVLWDRMQALFQVCRSSATAPIPQEAIKSVREYGEKIDVGKLDDQMRPDDLLRDEINECFQHLILGKLMNELDEYPVQLEVLLYTLLFTVRDILASRDPNDLNVGAKRFAEMFCYMFEDMVLDKSGLPDVE